MASTETLMSPDSPASHIAITSIGVVFFFYTDDGVVADRVVAFTQDGEVGRGASRIGILESFPGDHYEIPAACIPGDKLLTGFFRAPRFSEIESATKLILSLQ